MPPPPMPAMERSTNSCTEVCAKPQPKSPSPMRARHISSRFFRPKISDNRPLMSWNAVEAMRKDVPIHDVAVPVFRSPAMAGVAVDTLVWSTKETNRQTESAGMAIMSRLVDIVFLCPPMDSASLSSLGSSSTVAAVSGSLLSGVNVADFLRSSSLDEASANFRPSFVLVVLREWSESDAVTGVWWFLISMSFQSFCAWARHKKGT